MHILILIFCAFATRDKQELFFRHASRQMYLCRAFSYAKKELVGEILRHLILFPNERGAWIQSSREVIYEMFLKIELPLMESFWYMESAKLYEDSRVLNHRLYDTLLEIHLKEKCRTRKTTENLILLNNLDYDLEAVALFNLVKERIIYMGHLFELRKKIVGKVQITASDAQIYSDLLEKT